MKLCVLIVMIVCFTLAVVNCDNAAKDSNGTNEMETERKPVDDTKVESKQSVETNAPNFVRLVVMRLIYGIATQMGLEERVSGLFNGAFAPPNADYDDFGIGDLGLDGDADIF